MENNNPANKVFQVAELLEAIILDLPPHDIVAIRRVDRTFRNTIDGSTKIKQKALLLPTPETPEYWNITYKGRSAAKVAISTSTTPLAAKESTQPVFLKNMRFERYSLQLLEPKNLFCERALYDGRGEEDMHEIRMEIKNYDGQILSKTIYENDNHFGSMRWTPHAKFGDLNPADISQDSVWSRMLITHPPCQKAKISWWSDDSPRNEYMRGSPFIFRVENKDGLRIGDLAKDLKDDLAREGIDKVSKMKMFVVPEFGVFPTERTKEMVEDAQKSGN